MSHQITLSDDEYEMLTAAAMATMLQCGQHGR